MQINDIKSKDFTHKIDAYADVVEGLDDIDQCIRVILTTPVGSVPHNVGFGSNMYLYLDLPANQARPKIVREVFYALNRWEPRIQVKKAEISESAPGNLSVKVYWTLKNSDTLRFTEVKID